MKRHWVSLAVGAVLLVPAAALTYGVENGQTVSVPKGDTRSGTFYATGQSVTVDGDINGDLICAGQTVEVRGAVHGDVICAGQSVTVTGPVDGSVRLAGQTVSVGSTVGRNATVVAQAFGLGGGASVAGDTGLLAQTATLDGSVSKSLYGMMRNLALNGKVGGVDARIANGLTTGSNTLVAGDFNYSAPSQYNFDHSKVAGKVNYSNWQPQHAGARSGRGAGPAAWLGWVLYWLVAALVTGLVLVWLVPRLVRRMNRTLLEQPAQSLLWGAVVSLLGPVVVIFLMITVIGIPVGLLLAALLLLALVTSGLFAGFATGAWLQERLNWQRGSLVAGAVLGIAITVVLFNIPLVGWLLALVASWWVVGGLVLSARPARA